MKSGWYKESRRHREATYKGRKCRLRKGITNEEYLFGDADHDKIKNIDDSHPLDPKRNDTREIKLSEELTLIDQQRNEFGKVVEKVEKNLAKKGFETKSRVKGRNSILNKLRRKHFKRLTDIGGVMVLTNSVKESLDVGRFIEKNYYVEEKIDYYANPKDGYYRALHYLIRVGGNKLIEIQIKTKPEAELHQKAHYHYKMERLTPRVQNQFVKEFREIIKNEKGMA